MLLASGSPQRRAILEQLGVAFDVVVTGVDELIAGSGNANRGYALDLDGVQTWLNGGTRPAS